MIKFILSLILSLCWTFLFAGLIGYSAYDGGEVNWQVLCFIGIPTVLSWVNTYLIACGPKTVATVYFERKEQEQKHD